jgi:FkbM family methyltransferase
MFDGSGIRTKIAVVKAARGIEFMVVTDAEDRDDPVAASLAAGQFTVQALFDLLRRVVPSGGRVIDLGAHVGAFSLAAAAAGYDVVCVEASPRNAALLAAAIELNGFKNLRLVNAAVSDRAGKLSFFARGPYGHVAAAGDTSAILTVDALSVDDLMKRVGWETADFVKLDIEGSEVNAIKGMIGLMSRSDAPLLYCESNGHMLDVLGETPTSLKTALGALGCEIYLCEPHRLVRVQAQEPQGQTVVDYLAVKKLPAVLASGRVDPALTQAEQLAWLHASATSAAEAERQYAARVLRDASPGFRCDPAATAILASLCIDPSEKVRAVVQAIPHAPATHEERVAPTRERSWWRVF